jgi:hypothetical protein
LGLRADNNSPYGVLLDSPTIQKIGLYYVTKSGMVVETNTSL